MKNNNGSCFLEDGTASMQIGHLQRCHWWRACTFDDGFRNLFGIF